MTPTARTGFENLLALLSITAVLAIGGMVATLARDYGPVTRAMRAELPVPVMPEDPAESHEVEYRFNQGVALLHAKRYDYAMTAFARVAELAPNMPEAYVNLGFALLGEEDYQHAANAFGKAIDLRPEQANAYWGLALAYEALKDYEGALGAMRSYIHLSRVPNDPYITKARSALWEWEAQLGRIPKDADPSGLAKAPPQHLNTQPPAK